MVAAGLLGWWVGVASRPKDSKTAEMPSPNSREGELGAGGWGVRQTPFSPGKGSGEAQRIEARSAASSGESGVVPSTCIVMVKQRAILCHNIKMYSMNATLFMSKNTSLKYLKERIGWGRHPTHSAFLILATRDKSAR